MEPGPGSGLAEQWVSTYCSRMYEDWKMRRHMAVSEEGLGPGSVTGSVRVSAPNGGKRMDPGPGLSHCPLPQHSHTHIPSTHSAPSPQQPMGWTALLTRCPFPLALRCQWDQCQGWWRMAPPLGMGRRSHPSSASQVLGPKQEQSSGKEPDCGSMLPLSKQDLRWPATGGNKVNKPEMKA